MRKILLTCLIAVAFTACSSEDSSAPVAVNENETINPVTTLIGTWTEVGYESVNGTYLPSQCGEFRYKNTYIYNADGSFLSTTLCPDLQFELADISGTYTVSGNIITWHTADGNFTHKFSIEDNIMYSKYFDTATGQTQYTLKMQKQ